MEMNQTEVKKIADTSLEAQQQSFQELTDLQLVFVGGGCGEIVFG
jgi:hypothetical protein